MDISHCKDSDFILHTKKIGVFLNSPIFHYYYAKIHYHDKSNNYFAYYKKNPPCFSTKRTKQL